MLSQLPLVLPVLLAPRVLRVRPVQRVHQEYLESLAMMV
jgi:hypothetical protein